MGEVDWEQLKIQAMLKEGTTILPQWITGGLDRMGGLNAVATAKCIARMQKEGYKILYGLKIRENATIIVFIDPTEEYFVPFYLEAHPLLNKGRLVHYKINDKRKGMDMNKKLRMILDRNLELKWKCKSCGYVRIMDTKTAMLGGGYNCNRCYECKGYEWVEG